MAVIKSKQVLENIISHTLKTEILISVVVEIL